jgi:hypothetical protein
MGNPSPLLFSGQKIKFPAVKHHETNLVFDRALVVASAWCEGG